MGSRSRYVTLGGIASLVAIAASHGQSATYPVGALIEADETSIGATSWSGVELRHNDSDVRVAPRAAAPAGTSAPIGGFSIDPTTRKSSMIGYHRHYMPSQKMEGLMSWTGDSANCVPGTLAAVYHDAVLRRINYYRAMAGLPADIVFNAAKNAKCQETAVLMAKKNGLSHHPLEQWPGDPCVTAGADEAAGLSNLALGSFGPFSIDRLMIDDGDTNASVGHRRWFLYSRSQEMGHGSVPFRTPQNAACAVWVVGNFKSPPASKAVPWPPAGYVPYHLAPNKAYTQARWSFSYPGATFASANVTMTYNGSPVTVTKEPITEFIGDSTLVWKGADLPNTVPAAGTNPVINVQITGITAAPFTSYSYQTYLYNPFDLQETMTVTGTDTPPVSGGATYTFNQIDQAEAYCARVAETSLATWQENAEDSPTPKIIANVSNSPSYPWRSSALNSTLGNGKAFNILFTAKQDESIEVDRDLLPSATSRLKFNHLFRFFSKTSEFLAELSTDEGSSWTSVYSRLGVSNATDSSGWESAWTPVDIPVPAEFHGKQCRIRFRITHRGGTFFYYRPASDQPHWYGAFIDDITMTGGGQFTHQNITNLPAAASSFEFNGTTLGTTPVAGRQYLVQIAPVLGGHQFDFSAPKFIVPSSTISPGDQWRITYFGDAEASGDAADNADPDGDDCENLSERGLGTNPLNGAGTDATGVSPVASVSTSGAGVGKATLSFSLPAPAPPDITYRVQASSNATSWTTIAKRVGDGAWTDEGSGAIITQGSPVGGRVSCTVMDVVGVDTVPRRYLRLHLSAQ